MSQLSRLRFLPALFSASLGIVAVTVPSGVFALQAPISVLLQINRAAGSPAGASGLSGDGAAASGSLLTQPQGVTEDGAGNLYIADTGNNRVRRIDARTSVITTFAGTGQPGYSGDGGRATAAELNSPVGVLADAHGHIYIADTGNRIVRMVNLETGDITTVAGTPNLGSFDPASIGDGAAATAAELDSPAALALDSVGNLYVADPGDNRVREVSAATGTITTAAGTGAAGFSGDNGPAAHCTLNQPTGIGVDGANNLYIADSGNNVIRQVSSQTGVITTVVGVPGLAGSNGDGVATQTLLNSPTGIAVDLAGRLYFSDRGNDLIRELTTAGTVITLAGTGGSGIAGNGQLASSAQLDQPAGLAITPNGDLYVADSGNNQVRTISQGLDFPPAEIATNAPAGRILYLGLNQAATLSAPAFAPGENEIQEFTADAVSGCVTDGRTLNPQGSVCTLPVTFVPAYAGARSASITLQANGAPISFGVFGLGLGPQAVLVPGTIHTILPPGSSVTGGLPLTAPAQVIADPAGNLYVADPGSNQVVRQDAITGALTVIAGGGSLPPAQADGGPATDALLNGPSAIALDASGNLAISETAANRVRRVQLATGIITTVAGTGTPGYSGDGAPATAAELNYPSGIAANPAGDLFVADTLNNAVRRISIASGVITTVAGNGTPGYTGDLGFAQTATLNAPQGIAFQDTGRIVVADTGNQAIRSIDPATGIVSTLAGGFADPVSVGVDAAGDVFVADAGDARVFKISGSAGTVTTAAGSGVAGDSGDGGPATQAALSSPSGVAVDAIGQIYIADRLAASVRRLSTDTPVVNFGSEAVGGSTAPGTESLANIGNQLLTLAQVSPPVDFPEAPDSAECAAGTLNPGSACDLSFLFRPTVSGPLTEDALVLDNSLNSPGSEQALTMTGEGAATSPVSTSTSVSVSPSTVTFGAPVSLTATVSAGPGTIVNGNVAFAVNGIEIASAALVGPGTATVTLPAMPAGTDVVTADFAAQGEFSASSSAPAALIVAAASPIVALSATPQQVRLGQNVVLTANVNSQTGGQPTGTVVFMANGAQFGQAIVSATGQAILTVQNLPAGNDSITAQYLGDPNFASAASAPLQVIVANDSLSMTANPGQLTIAPEATGDTTVTLTPRNGFSGTVNLSCAGLAQTATCRFSSASVTFSTQSQGAQTVRLTIQPTIVAGAGAGVWRGRGAGRMLLLLLSLLTPLLLARARRRRPSSGWMCALLLAVLAGMGTLTGCGNMAPRQPVSASITVQASTPLEGVITSAPLLVYMQQ